MSLPLWNAIDNDLIQQSFKYYDISNSQDETEDELIFDFNSLEKLNQLNNEIELNIRKDNIEDDCIIKIQLMIIYRIIRIFFFL